MPRGRLSVGQLMPIHFARSGCFGTTFGVSTNISRMHRVSAMVIQSADSTEFHPTLGAIIFEVFVVLPEVSIHADK